MRKMNLAEWCMENKKEYILNEWDKKRNTITPDKVECYSKAGVYWICEDCGKRWRSSVFTRTYYHHGCPTCERHIVEEYGEGENLSNTLAYSFPELAEEWHQEKNGELTPDDVSMKSNRKVWWKCSICGHEWQARIDNRTNGHNCPECAKAEPEEYAPNEYLVCKETSLIYVSPFYQTTDIKGISIGEILNNVPMMKPGKIFTYKGLTFERYIL